MTTRCVCRADKGSSVVVLDKATYVEKMRLILNDKEKFSQDNLKSLSQLRLEANKRVSALKNLDFPTTVTNRLSPVQCVLPELYGLLKIHKPVMPLRPILSMTNSPTYNLAKWLAKRLKPVEEAVIK